MSAGRLYKVVVSLLVPPIIELGLRFSMHYGLLWVNAPWHKVDVIEFH